MKCAVMASLVLLAVTGFFPGMGFAKTPVPAQREITPVLETRYLTFRLSPQDGSYELLDKQTQVSWRSNPYKARFGAATLVVDGQKQQVDLAQCEVQRTGDGLEARFHPLPSKPEWWLSVRMEPIDDGKGLEFSYTKVDGTTLEEVRLLDDAFWTPGGEKGFVAVPVRMGLLIPADSGVKFLHTFDTYAYEGCHMQMFGVGKNGAAALITWDDPYVAAEVKSEIPPSGKLAGTQVLSTSLRLRKSANPVQVRFLGAGDYVTIAKAYREIAARRGWLVSWSKKLARNPDRAKLFGAINYKLWALLDREMNEESTQQEVLKVNWTFDEAAQVAEHLKNDLKLDKVLFIMGGWTHRGYDNQHPDILPANPECGGDEKLAACARRVMGLGYLFCLHDNYQDIYRDSPSWNEALIMKHPDGSLVKGGKWWGGRAYLTCSEEALKLAERPGNLPAVKKLTDANSYFIDTTYASGLQECFDPRHPLTRADDMKWKQALSDYARNAFGIFGSEDGREWAVPHADFFEGLNGVDGDYFHDKKLMSETGGVSIPLFELVYRDCVALYGKYGFDISKSADYVLYHISIGRTLNYHEIPPHLYWKDAGTVSLPTSEAALDPAVFTRGDGGWAEGLNSFDRFVKNTYEILSPLYELTATMQMAEHRFLTPDHKVQLTVFGTGPDAVEVVVNGGTKNFKMKSQDGSDAVLPPYGFEIESPTFTAFRALAWNDLSYASAPLFTLRAMDGLPLSRSAKVRAYHGFGDARVRFRNEIRIVQKEALFSGAP